MLEEDEKDVAMTNISTDSHLFCSIYLVSPPSSRFLKSWLVHVENFSRM